jgi:hypothetical protein
MVSRTLATSRLCDVIEGAVAVQCKIYSYGWVRNSFGNVPSIVTHDEHDVDARQRQISGGWTATMVCTFSSLVFYDPCPILSYALNCSKVLSDYVCALKSCMVREDLCDERAETAVWS